MTQHENDKIDTVLKALKDISTEVASIKRGVYGDPANGVRGLIQRQDDDEKRLTSLENFNRKMVWIGTAFIVSAQLAWAFIKEKFW